jgi:membrane-bound serine protease (ClpP class)
VTMLGQILTASVAILNGGPDRVAAASALMMLAALLLVLEVFIVSFGILSILAIAAGAWSVSLAFEVSATTGWTFLVAAPVFAGLILRWGLRRVQISRAVPQSEISDHAGAQHLATQIGIEPGSHGLLVTPARPGGRARFPGGDCDVQVQGGSLEKGSPIIVKRIDGPMVVVARAPAGAASEPDAPNGREE